MGNLKPHAIVFPYPYQGHITPTTILSLELASKGFIITFIQAQFIHRSISNAHNLSAQADIFTDARKAGLDIRYMEISDGFPVDFDRHLNYHQYWDTMFREFPARVDDVVAKIIGADDSSSFFVVTDTFYSWIATSICKKYDLTNVSLWTEPALVFSINYHWDLITSHGHSPSVAGKVNSLIDYIPGVDSISTTSLMSYIQYPDMIPMLTEVVVKGFHHVKEADFILCNTVEELESQTLSALNQIHPTLAIGPINFYAASSRSVHRSLMPETDCSEWLNSKPHGSVLYISFGSIVTSSEEVDTAEFFHGLLRSEVCFIWVIKSDDRALPSGFEDGVVGDRGLVVPWCDQNRVLSHPSVGGFLTHCGWNSILESIWHCVPMICHPCLVDQPTNKKLVVDDWKIGITLCGEEQVGRDEVCEKINMLMKGETGYEMRREIKNVCKILQDSLGAGGSSHKNVDRFVEELKLKLLIQEYHKKGEQQH